MSEGGLNAPVRHPIDWNDPDFYDWDKINAEVERVFDICHGCRRCFNLCDSFPRLFDLIDDSETGELDSVDKADYKPVVDACTLCDMCFMVSCPYVPPHEFNIDFPHLMLRYRAAEHQRNGADGWTKQLTETDRNGKAASFVAPLANWAGSCNNKLTRPAMEAVTRIRGARGTYHCEVSAMVYGTFVAMAEIEELAGDGEASAKYRAMAEDLGQLELGCWSGPKSSAPMM